jgi:hypothetical protein
MREPDASPATISLSIVGLGFSMLVGYVLAGPWGALLGAITGTTGVLVFHHRSRVARRPRLLDLQSMGSLAPDRALDLWAAGRASSQPPQALPAFKSDIVARIESALAETAQRPDAALERIEALRDDHPRSAAVWAELVRRHLAVGDSESAWQALDRALVLALDGGMNPLAARLAAEFPERQAHLDLDDAYRVRLDRAIAASGGTAPRSP